MRPFLFALHLLVEPNRPTPIKSRSDTDAHVSLFVMKSSEAA